MGKVSCFFVILISMAELQPESPLKKAVLRAVFAALKRVCYVLAGVCLWILLLRLEIVHPRYMDAGTVVLGAVLFFLALPVSIIIRLDTLSENLPVESYGMVLLCGVAVVALNWILIAALRALVKPQSVVTEKQDADPSRQSTVKPSVKIQSK